MPPSSRVYKFSPKNKTLVCLLSQPKIYCYGYGTKDITTINFYSLLLLCFGYIILLNGHIAVSLSIKRIKRSLRLRLLFWLSFFWKSFFISLNWTFSCNVVFVAMMLYEPHTTDFLWKNYDCSLCSWVCDRNLAFRLWNS